MKNLEAIISPYLEIDGVDLAALVSSDGLLVAAVGNVDLNREAIAAYVATTISAADELSTQLDSGRRRLVTLDLPDRGLIIAPVSTDLMLVLVGQNHITRSLVEGTGVR